MGDCYLQSIFERVRVRRDGAWVEVPLPTAPEPAEVTMPQNGPLELEAWAGNLAEARWLSGSVRLTVSGDQAAVLPLTAPVAFQGSGHFGPGPLVGGGRLRLQLAAAGRASFGEVVELVWH
ncbi:MAG: hypothetical protein HYU66_02400 [Armatimonadetes bacterium]|nr:hypothetical protein [Armatimonadota bacterium]